MFTDSHAHLDDQAYNTDRDEVVKRAEAAGVRYIVNAGSNPKDNAAIAELADRYPAVYSAAGIHPHHAAQAVEADFEEVKRLSARSKAVAIGETGLDYYNNQVPADTQKKVFRRCIEFAKKLALPIILHSRDADEDCIEVLRAENAQECGGVLHCFNGSVKMRDEALRLGFYIAVGGAVTFPKAEALREGVKGIPLSRLLLETDCPYLAPKTVRGKRNEPANIVEIAQKVTEVLGRPLSEIETASTSNAGYLFGVGIKTQGKIVYEIRDQLYLNITNRCSNHCTFCIRNGTDFVKGHNLRLKKEPTASEVISAIGDPKKYREVVFCGYGEPLIRLSAVKEISAWVKENGGKTRIDTNGQANLLHRRPVAAELADSVDAVSVSLNAQDSGCYQKMCCSQYGESAYEGVKEFVLDAKKHIKDVTVTFVTVPGVDTESCKQIAEKELGAKYRVREYGKVG